jgi:hypothetical protein
VRSMRGRGYRARSGNCCKGSRPMDSELTP